jgi:hypothetical protein
MTYFIGKLGQGIIFKRLISLKTSLVLSVRQQKIDPQIWVTLILLRPQKQPFRLTLDYSRD